jgi:hypothetical protein
LYDYSKRLTIKRTLANGINRVKSLVNLIDVFFIHTYEQICHNCMGRLDVFYWMRIVEEIEFYSILILSEIVIKRSFTIRYCVLIEFIRELCRWPSTIILALAFLYRADAGRFFSGSGHVVVVPVSTAFRSSSNPSWASNPLCEPRMRVGRCYILRVAIVPHSRPVFLSWYIRYVHLVWSVPADLQLNCIASLQCAHSTPPSY